MVKPPAGPPAAADPVPRPQLGIALELDKRISSVSFDIGSLGRRSPDSVHERDVAVFDLIDSGQLILSAGPAGPYQLTLGLVDGGVAIQVAAAIDPSASRTVVLPARALYALVKQYGVICDSYFAAVRMAPPSRIALIDDERRLLHDRGARLLREAIATDISVDDATARRLFTLVATLVRRG